MTGTPGPTWWVVIACAVAALLIPTEAAAVGLSSLTLTPESVVGGAPSTGQVTLDGPAPAGVVVTLTSSRPTVAAVPASVPVPQGATFATFPVTTFAVGANTTSRISGTYLGVTRSRTLTVTASPVPISLTLVPVSVVGGATSTGTVTLNGAAPVNGTVVTLTSTKPSVASVPGTTTVLEGQVSGTFTVTTVPVAATTNATIKAAAGGVQKTRGLTIKQPSVSALSLSPGSVVGGNPSTGTVTLNGAAPPAGMVVTLASANTAVATVPASVTVTGSQSSAPFPVTTAGVASTTGVKVTATGGGTSRNKMLTVTRASLVSLSLSPSTVPRGSPSTGTLTLDGQAPSAGLVISLSSSNPALASVPSTATLAAFATGGTFPVTTHAGGAGTSADISGTLNGVTRTATLTVQSSGVVRGAQGDGWADVILGKPDFSEFTPNEVVPYKVFNPGGVHVDRSVSPGRAYVWDSGNSRVLGIDLGACYAGTSPCTAAVVIGQPSGSNHSACNGDSGFQGYPNRAPASASSLCGIPEDTLSILENKSFVSMTSDASGTLYVPDVFNHRLLKYVSPFTTDTVADEVWGQATFADNTCNRGLAAPTASTLCFASVFHFGSGAELDAAGNLWVADGGNNRVLRFPRNSMTGVIAKTADLVLGQPGFATADPGTSLARFNSPASLRFRPNGQMYVADSGNNRVLVFTPPFATGMSASGTFGTQLANPFGLEVDPAGAGVWINDFGNHMIELWDFDGVTVKKVLGKDTYQPNGACQEWLCDSGGGFGIDTQGNILPAIYAYVQDVPRFKAPIPDPQPGVVYQPDRRLFAPPDGYNARGLHGIRSGHGLATAGDQLVVADAGRLLFWNGLATLSSGQAATGFVGTAAFEYQPSCCMRLKVDSANRLWVLRNEGVDLFQMPLASGSTALDRILEPSSVLPLVGGGTLTLGDRLDGLAPVGAGAFAWVADTNNSRVIRVRNPLTAPVVDVVLGQSDANGTECNRGLVPAPNTGTTEVATLDMLCYPGALSIDRLGNLYVSDSALEAIGNWRLLIFPASLFPSNPAAPIFAPVASKTFPYLNTQPGITWEPAFDSANRMAVGYNGYLGGRFVGVYQDPLGPATNPDTYLNDYWSMPYAATFDQDDNLYIGDLNRSRVLIYRKPLAP